MRSRTLSSRMTPLGVLTMLACASSPGEARDPAAPAEAPAEPAAATSDGLVWTVEAHPARLTMAERGNFRLRRSVTNGAAEPRDAMRAFASFTLDGEPSHALDLAFGNGAREDRWSALPPHETVFDERAMGESLFGAPGTYRIAMTVDGATSSVTVQVDP